MNCARGRLLSQTAIIVGLMCWRLCAAGGAPATAAERVENTVTVSNETASPLHDYPLQLGRPFPKGAIPAGRCPHLVLGGGKASRQTPLASQADVKNRYPDGSVEYAVLAAVLPVVPTHAGLTLGFEPGDCANQPLSKTQMLSSSFDFDAKITFTSPATLYSRPLAPAAALPTWTSITDGGFSILVSGRTYTLTGLDFSKQKSLPGIAGVVAAALKTAGVPVRIALQQKAIGDLGPGGAATPLAIRFVLATIGFSGSETISEAKAPASGTDISPMLGLGTGAAVAPGKVQTVSARTMLANGNYTLWTSGPIAQTIELADDGPARRYDIGFGDGYHPLRPRFYATFWPATHQVSVRVVAENGLTSEVEDLAYKLSITAGQTPPNLVYSGDLSGTQTTHPKSHWALTAWTERFWINGTPSPQLNIDNNLAYLAATRFLPHYDTSITPTAADIGGMYGYWTGKPHDLYDGAWDGGLWQSGMGAAGARGEIAPYPVWTALWLYTGDWRLRQMALGMADLAASWPAQLREDVAGKRLSRADAAGSSTGLGHTVSITDRKSLLSQYLTYNYTKPMEKVAVVGPVDANGHAPWSFDTQHQPSPFYPQYVVTGDPWHLNEMYLWAGFTAASYNGVATNSPGGRGPTGAEGGISDILRGDAWAGRNRAETAFVAPDSDPEKTYFTYLTNDALARWEGGLGITGTVYDGNAEKTWGAKVGNVASWNRQVPPLGEWQATGPADNSQLLQDVIDGIYPPAPASISFVGSIAATRLTVTSVTAGKINYLTLLSDSSGALAPASFVDSGSGTGGPGTYEVRPKQNVMSEPMSGSYGSDVVGAFDAIWTEWYLTYALARIEELGFAADPLRARHIQFAIGMINSSWPQLITVYHLPVASPRAWYTNWSQVAGGFTTAFLTGNGWLPSQGRDLHGYFAANLSDDGRQIWLMPGLAGAVSRGDPGAAPAWRWFLANVYRAIPSTQLKRNPKWAIVPRTDGNTLPIQSTGIPPS